MSNSWDNYFDHYTDWDDAHCFNVRLELKFEDNIKSLGYQEYIISDDLYLPENNLSFILDKEDNIQQYYLGHKHNLFFLLENDS